MKQNHTNKQIHKINFRNTRSLVIWYIITEIILFMILICAFEYWTSKKTFLHETNNSLIELQLETFPDHISKVSGMLTSKELI